MDKDQFLNWESASRDTIDVKRVYIHLAGDIVTGVLLSQIIYLFLPDRNGNDKPQLVERDGHLWITIKRTDWWDECCVSPKQFDRSCAILEELDHDPEQKRGFIVAAVYKNHRGETVKHIRINWEVFLEALKKYGAETAPNRRRSPKAEGGNRELPKGEFPNDGQQTMGEADPEFPKGQFPNQPNGNSGIDESAIPLHTETLKKTQEEESGVLTLNVSGGVNSVVSGGEEADPCGDDPGEEWGDARPTKALDIMALRVAMELKDIGSQRRHRQLVGICQDNALLPLIDQALRATKERMADEKRLGPLEKPARYYDATLVRLLTAEGVHVPRKAEVRETMTEMRDVLGLAPDASPEEIREALRRSLAGDDGDDEALPGA